MHLNSMLPEIKANILRLFYFYFKLDFITMQSYNISYSTVSKNKTYLQVLMKELLTAKNNY